MSNLFNKVKGTMSKYDIELDDKDIIQIINQLKKDFKKDLIDKLPTIKEIEADLANQPRSEFTRGIAEGAKNIIKQLQKL